MGNRARGRSRSSTTREHLLAWIAKGKVRPGGQLPPEPQLAGELGVSRPTLREALRSLEDEGVVTRSRGAGTFVSHRPRLRNNLDVNFGVTDAIRQSGMEPGQRSAVTSIVPTTCCSRASIFAADATGTVRAGPDALPIQRSPISVSPDTRTW